LGVAFFDSRVKGAEILILAVAPQNTMAATKVIAEAPKTQQEQEVLIRNVQRLNFSQFATAILTSADSK